MIWAPASRVPLARADPSASVPPEGIHVSASESIRSLHTLTPRSVCSTTAASGNAPGSCCIVKYAAIDSARSPLRLCAPAPLRLCAFAPLPSHRAVLGSPWIRNDATSVRPRYGEAKLILPGIVPRNVLAGVAESRLNQSGRLRRLTMSCAAASRARSDASSGGGISRYETVSSSCADCTRWRRAPASVLTIVSVATRACAQPRS